MQEILVQTRRTAAQNRVELYRALGGDSLIHDVAWCTVCYVSHADRSDLASFCPPLQP